MTLVLCSCVLSPSLAWAHLCSALSKLCTSSQMYDVRVHHKLPPGSNPRTLYLAPPLPPLLHMCLCRVWFFLAFKEKVVSLITEIERKAKVSFQQHLD